jgi:hypothetical protein
VTTAFAGTQALATGDTVLGTVTPLTALSATTTGFPTSGKLFVTHGTTVDTLVYNGFGTTTAQCGGTSTSCFLILGTTAGAGAALATGDTIQGGAQTSSYAVTGSTPVPHTGDFFQIGGSGPNVQVLASTADVSAVFFATPATTVAAGSNGVSTNTFTGAQTLNVTDTSAFPAPSGTIKITVSGVTDTITYTGTTATSFTGVTLTAGANIVLATGNPVVSASNLATTAFTGAAGAPSTLQVTSTTNFPGTGTLNVTHSGTTDVFTYTGTTASSFTGVTYVSGTVFNLTAGDRVALVQTSGTFTITWDSPGVLGNGAAVQTTGPNIAAGGTDLNVIGANNGVGGAVRELTRFMCRGSQAQEGIDPFTGKNYALEITSAVNAAGFTTVPSALQSTGSRCQVLP